MAFENLRRRYLARPLVADEKVRARAAAVLLARDLMRGDPAAFKAGYTAENAALAAEEVFPECDGAALRAALGSPADREEE